MAFFIVSLDFSLIECGSEHWDGSSVQEGLCGLGDFLSKRGKGGASGEDLQSCQAAVSPLLMTVPGTLQASNADCRGW